MFCIDEMEIDTESTAKVHGKVLLFTSRDSTEPLMAFHQEVTPKLSTVLQELSGRYSPVQSKCFHTFVFFFIIVIY